MRLKPIIFILLLFQGSSTVAWAQGRHFEVIPFLGFRLGGGFQDAVRDETRVVDESMVGGLTVDIDYDATGQVQLLWSRQSTEFKPLAGATRVFELNIDYYHFGGTYSWARSEKIKPYVALSAGVTHLQPMDSGYNDEWRISAGLGLGVKYFVTPWFGLMLEGRAFGTFMGGSGTIFCSNSGCQIAIDQDLFGQFEGRTGIVIRF